MPAGTIALTNNSTTVGGTGTAFTSELKVGDFIGVTVGGSPYTMIVASIASNTQLTIAQAYNGPTASGLAWYGVPATLKYAITQQVLNDMATNQRGMIAQLANWQKIYSDAASVTVERPDRSSFTGPSWGYMSAQYTNKAAKGANSDITSLSGLTTPISMAQGGLGSTNKDGALRALGFGSSGMSWQKDTDAALISSLRTELSGFYRNDYDTAYSYRYAASVLSRTLDTFTFISSSYIGQGIIVTAGNANGNATNVYKLWTDRNTTVDTNNFIKRASPIARLANDVSQMQPDFAVDEQHVVAGLVSVNAEAEGVSAEKTATGIYKVKGAVGLADEGWTLEVPQDINGNRLCFVELDTDKEGAITVSVFKRRFDVDSAMIVAGEPMDIPEGRWIDLRLQMPEDSAWNTRMREMEQSAQGEKQTS